MITLLWLVLSAHRVQNTTICGETQEKFYKFLKTKGNLGKLTLGPALNNLLADGLGQLGVVAGLHGIVATALGLGTQVSGVAEHGGQRHIGVHLDGAGTGDLAQNVAAAGRITGLAFLQASLNAMEPAILKAISEESTSW